MKHTQNEARREAGHGEINCRRQRQRRYDQQRPETESAIQEFLKWDREMMARHGRLYHRKLGYTVH